MSETRVLDTFGYAATWEEAAPYLRQRIFGAIVALAAPVVKEFYSDLYWAKEYVDTAINGTGSYLIMVRTSGVECGGAALASRDVGALGGILYRLTIAEERGRWTISATEEWRSEK